jgi:hypothetical protein
LVDTFGSALASLTHHDGPPVERLASTSLIYQPGAIGLQEIPRSNRGAIDLLLVRSAADRPMSDRITLSTTFWVRVAVVLPLALLLHYALDGWLDLRNDTGNVAAFVTAVGTLYSVSPPSPSSPSGPVHRDRPWCSEAREPGELWRHGLRQRPGGAP